MCRCSPETRSLSWLTLCALLFMATIGVEAAHRYVVGSSADVAPNAVRYTNIGSSSSTNGYVLTSDGSNNSTWVANPGASDLPLAGGTMTGNILANNTSRAIGSSGTPFGFLFTQDLESGTGQDLTLLGNGAGNVVLSVNSGAGGFVNFVQTTQTGIGANGAASALTALPVGYLPIKVNGTEYEIPYYNH